MGGRRREACCTNKANLKRSLKLEWQVSKARRQSEEPLRETKPISEGIGVQGSGVSHLTPGTCLLTHELSCETNPICRPIPIGRSAFPKGRACETNPICRPSGYPIIHYSSIPIGCRLCETKPICLRWTGKTIPKARGLEAATHPWGQLHRTKPICPQAGRVAVQAIASNKANSAKATRRTKPLWTKGYGELGVQNACAKQSQFAARVGGPASGGGGPIA